MGSDYYSVQAIMAEETHIPARLVHGCTGGAPAAPLQGQRWLIDGRV